MAKRSREPRVPKGTKEVTRRERGALLSVGIPALFILYFFTPQRPVQFITLFLILLILCSKGYSEYLIRHLNLVRRDLELRTFRNEWIEAELWIENTGRLPAFMLVLWDQSGGIAVFRNIRLTCTLLGRSRQAFRWEAFGSRRGVFTLGPASFQCADPLGLFPFLVTREESSRLFVYPAPAFALLKSPGGIPLGNLISRDPFNEDLTRPRSLRDYKSGDEARRINWKASARSNTLLINEYEPSLSYNLVVFMNIDPLEYAVRSREAFVERVIEAAAALCLMASRERQTLGLILHSRHTREEDEPENQGISPAAFTLIPILERLAALEPFTLMNEAGRSRRNSGEEKAWGSGTGSAIEGTLKEGELRLSTQRILEKSKTLPFGSRLIYIGPALAEQDYNALEILRRQRLTLEYLIIDQKSILEYESGGFKKHQIREMGYELL